MEGTIKIVFATQYTTQYENQVQTRPCAKEMAIKPALMVFMNHYKTALNGVYEPLYATRLSDHPKHMVNGMNEWCI